MSAFDPKRTLITPPSGALDLTVTMVRPDPRGRRCDGASSSHFSAARRSYGQLRSAAGLLTAAKKTRRSSLHSIAPTGAILINALTLGGWYLLPGLAVAISCATGIYAFLFSCLSRRSCRQRSALHYRLRPRLLARLASEHSSLWWKDRCPRTKEADPPVSHPFAL